MNAPRVRLGELLVRAGLISRPELEEALAAQKRDGRRLGTLLVETGLVSEAQVTQILSQQLSVPWVSLHHIDFSEQLLRLVPRELVEKYCLVPIYVRRVRGLGDALYVAMDDPTNAEALQEVARHAGLHVRPMIAPPEAIRLAIRDNYGVDDAPDGAALQPYGAGDDDGTQTNPRRGLASVEDVDEDDTAVRWRHEILDTSDYTASRSRVRVDSVVDLEDTSDVLEIPPDDYGLAPIDDSMLTETTGTLSIDDPDVVEVSGPVHPVPQLAQPTEPAASSEPEVTFDDEAAVPSGGVDPDGGEAEAVPLVRPPSRPVNAVPSAPPQSSPSPVAAVPPGLRRSSPPQGLAARVALESEASASADGGLRHSPPPPSAPRGASSSAPPRSVPPVSFGAGISAPPRPGTSPPAVAPSAQPAFSPPPVSPPPAPSPLPSARPAYAAPPSARPAYAAPPSARPAYAAPPSARPALSPPPASAPPPPSAPPPSAPSASPPSSRSMSLTLLDGTTINLPRPGTKPDRAAERRTDEPSIRDVIAALRASARGADASDVLGDRARWEVMFAALLSVLVRKGLLTEAEFLEELDKG